MPNVFKYSPGSVGPGCLYKSGFMIGNNTADYGATFYTGIAPGASGYVIYQNKASGGPSIYVAADDSRLISLTTAQVAGGPDNPAPYTTATQCLTYFATQLDKICVNRDYEGIVTSELSLNLDAGYTPSYPKSGTTWYDIGPSGNNGNLINGPTYSSSNGGSIVFDGVNDYVQVNNTTTASFTIACWISSTATGSGSPGNPAYLGSGIIWSDVSGSGNDFVLAMTGKVPAWFTGNPDSNINDTSPINTGAWFYLTATKNGVSGIKSLHVNGALKTSGSCNANVLNANPKINIGANTLDARYFNGNISSVQIYNRALSPTEVLQNYQALFPRFLGKNIVTSGLIEYLDAGYSTSYGGTGTTWYNVAGTVEGNGTLTNGPTYDSGNGGSIVFDGVDDDVIVPTNTNLELTNNLTINLWVYSISPKSGLGIVCKGPLVDDYDYMVYITGNSTTVSFFKKDSTGTAEQRSGFSSTLLNKWVNICYTKNGTTLKGYENGVLRATSDFTNSSIRTSSQPLNIGRGWSATLNGKIPSVQIYDRGLNSSEVFQNYQAFLPQILGQNIVTSGLIEYLDVGYSTSYGGTGTTWNNVAGTAGGTGTLVNGPTYISGTGGSFSFDGVDDLLLTSSVNNFQSIGIFLYLTGAGSGWKYIMDARVGMSNSWFSLFAGGGGIGSAWTSMYINGVQTSLSYANIPLNQWFYLYVSSNVLNTADITFMNRYVISEGAQGNISIIQAYNRSLSQSEILQNYNAQKSRFGL
jgi:hypothetical protein